MKFIIAAVVVLSVAIGIQSRIIKKTGYNYGYNYGGNSIRRATQPYPAAAGRRIAAPRKYILPATVNIVADLDYELAAQSPAVFAIAPKTGVARKAGIAPQASNTNIVTAKPDTINKAAVAPQTPKVVTPKPAVVNNDSVTPQAPTSISGHGAIYIAKTLGSFHAAPLYGHTKSSINIA